MLVSAREAWDVLAGAIEWSQRLGKQAGSSATYCLSLKRFLRASVEGPAARAALVHNPPARVIVIYGFSHWFQDGAGTGAEEEVAKLGPNLGSPRLVTLVGNWLRDAFAPGSGKTRTR